MLGRAIALPRGLPTRPLGGPSLFAGTEAAASAARPGDDQRRIIGADHKTTASASTATACALSAKGGDLVGTIDRHSEFDEATGISELELLGVGSRCRCRERQKRHPAQYARFHFILLVAGE
jgi:hypothetical protein